MIDQKEKKKIALIAIFIFGLFSLLIIQYFTIQVADGDKWQKKARAQHEFFVREPCRRGTFFANHLLKKGHPENLQPLVFDVTKFHLQVDPLAIPKQYHSEIINLLETFVTFEQDPAEELSKHSRCRTLAKWLNREEKDRITTWWQSFVKGKKIAKNALFFTTDYERSYPFGKLLGQVLHTIRDIKNEKTLEGFPTGGLEAYFNEYLKGKSGLRKLLRSPHHKLEVNEVIEQPIDGADIYLTVNHCIQAIAEEEVEKGVKAAKAKGGWAVMMDPKTGEILALAQYPFFDPANYREYFNHSERIDDAKVKAITDAFELGSIMKPITIAIALKANEELEKKGKSKLFEPFEKIDTTRSIYPGRASKPLKDLVPHKFLNMPMSIQKSSNVYMAQLVDKIVHQLGPEWYRQCLIDLFGFGGKTQIELPAEATGQVPSFGKKHPNGSFEWSLATPYSLAIGYNILATSLQMLRAYSVFANGGYLVSPTLIKKITHKTAGQELCLLDHSEIQSFRKVLSHEIVQEVVRAMKYTTKPYGTGTLAAINGYTEAGKTGTAEKIVDGVYSKQHYISSFIGFAPANSNFEKHPASFVLIVTIDEPAPIFLDGGIKNYQGGYCAAPVFREIAKRTLEYLGVIPDDPFGYPIGDPRFNLEKADWMQEVKDLKILYDKWNST